MTVVWITGLPASGKSTLAQRLHQCLAASTTSSVMLDSDEVRTILGLDGYDPVARDAFYRTLAGLAALIARQGPIAIVAATAPLRAHRAFARGLVIQEGGRFVEVFVDTPLAACAQRDRKGLYAAARRGDVATLPGSGAAFEPPTAPDVTAHGGEDTDAVIAIARRCRPHAPPT